LRCTIRRVNAVTRQRNGIAIIQPALGTVHRTKNLFRKKRSFFGGFSTIIINSSEDSLFLSISLKLIPNQARSFSFA